MALEEQTQVNKWRWQFSLRGMFRTTTLAAVLLSAICCLNKIPEKKQHPVHDISGYFICDGQVTNYADDDGDSWVERIVVYNPDGTTREITREQEEFWDYIIRNNGIEYRKSEVLEASVAGLSEDPFLRGNSESTERARKIINSYNQMCMN
ncbi:hypothetical protein GF386_01225 [Candidatus Pacearchaeota archaeon]|nr:hypothetical protein [Candidatus Pacearchaeota archaeon]